MNIQEKLQNIIDETFIFIAKRGYKAEVDKALKVFKSPLLAQALDIDFEGGFNNWLIHDYKKEDGSYIVNDYLKNINRDLEMFEVINKSIISIFKISNQKNDTVFKDIITNVDYVIDTDTEYNDGSIIEIRIYPYNNKYVIIDTGRFYGNELEPTIKKSLMSKYNEYCSVNEPVGIDTFIKENSLMIYHLNNIIAFYENELTSEEDLSVFVVTYGVKDKKVLIEYINKNNLFQIIDDYGDELVIDFIDGDVKLGELVITPNKLEFESTLQTDLEKGKVIIKDYFNDIVMFIKEEEVHLEDLL